MKLLIVGILHLLFVLNATKLTAQDLHFFSYEQPKMGTQVRLLFYAHDSLQANHIAASTFNYIDFLNLIFSDYIPNSEINQLSATAARDTCVKVSNELWELLSIAQTVSKQTKGNFDITIGPLSKLWRRMFSKGEFVGGGKVNSTKKLVNYRWLKLHEDRQCACLLRPNMRLDAGGIAKGYILDKTYDYLQSLGIQHVLLDAGGDLRIGLPPPHSKGWTIQRDDEILYLSETAMASSGDTYRYLIWKDKRYSHIINPKTGYGVQNAPIVSVQANTATLADAYASAFSVMPKWKSKKLAKKLNLQVTFSQSKSSNNN